MESFGEVAGMEAWQAGATPNLRTSLISDPPDGRLPPLTPEAQKRREAAAAAAKQRNPGVGIRTFGNLYTRCVLGLGAVPLVRGGNPGADSAAAAAGVTAEALFFQSPGYVTIVMQSNNDVRIIPVDGRAQIPGHVRQWLGESRGRWEGNTLVVDTTNFTGLTANFRGSGEKLHLVERFTRVSDETLMYQFTVDDPTTWARPWTAEIPMTKTQGPVYEWACHEGNNMIVNILQGARVADEEAARKTAK